jgi:hypothetical protein
VSAKTERLLQDMFGEIGPARKIHDGARIFANITRDDLVQLINDVRVTYAPNLGYTEGNMLYSMTLFLVGAYLGRKHAFSIAPKQ